MLPHQDPQKKLQAATRQTTDVSAGKVNSMTRVNDAGVPAKPQNAGPIPIDPEDGWLKRKAKGYLNKRANSAMGDLIGKDPNEGGQSQMQDPNTTDPRIASTGPKANPPKSVRPKANPPTPKPPAVGFKAPTWKGPKLR